MVISFRNSPCVGDDVISLSIVEEESKPVKGLRNLIPCELPTASGRTSIPTVFPMHLRDDTYEGILNLLMAGKWTLTSTEL